MSVFSCIRNFFSHQRKINRLRVDMNIQVLTIFPELITSYIGASLLGRATANNLLAIRPVNIRDFSTNKHKTVDDTPYGGGAGMVMKPEPIYHALMSIGGLPFTKEKIRGKIKKIVSGQIVKKKHIVLLSPRGRQFTQRIAEEWSTFDELTFVCGRYEGIDQRVVDHMVDEEISVGPYVLAGGELGALIIIEAVARLIPGVLGNPESLAEETFGRQSVEDRLPTTDGENINLDLETFHEYPQYTKPADFRGWKVPDVLLSGDHKKIDEWRRICYTPPK